MASDKTALGDRMKSHEAVTRLVLPRRTWSVCRVDIRAAHSYLRGAVRPFDEEFMADMDGVARELCGEIMGAVFAYTQSDEVSVLFTDFGSEATEPWFGGVVAKQATIVAALATAVLAERRPGRPGLRGLFDARVFSLPDPVEVANYFVWRQRDAIRNSIAMAAQAVLSPKQLHGVNGEGMKELLRAEGIEWDEYPVGCRRGRVAVKRSGEREVVFTDRRTGLDQSATAVRSWWESEGAPMFSAGPEGFLAETIPAAPLVVAAAGGSE